jgi:hypothetical protein
MLNTLLYIICKVPNPGISYLNYFSEPLGTIPKAGRKDRQAPKMADKTIVIFINI